MSAPEFEIDNDFPDIRMLMRSLIGYQRSKQWADFAMAKALGISRSRWASLRLGLQPAGPAVALAAAGIPGFRRAAKRLYVLLSESDRKPVAK